jgi:hypothetical protein
MWTEIFTTFAILLNFATSKPPYNTNLKFSKATNGTFYDPKTKYIASLLFVNGQFLGQFPIHSSKVRGGIACTKSGYILVGYFKIVNNKLYFSETPLLTDDGIPCDTQFWNEIKWALTGGGLYLLHSKPVRNVHKKENLSQYITKHPKYSFILVHQDMRTITIGISTKTPPEKLAQKLQGKYFAMLRLDGGSSTKFFSGSLPKSTNNAIGITF